MKLVRILSLCMTQFKKKSRQLISTDDPFSKLYMAYARYFPDFLLSQYSVVLSCLKRFLNLSVLVLVDGSGGSDMSLTTTRFSLCLFEI